MAQNASSAVKDQISEITKDYEDYVKKLGSLFRRGKVGFLMSHFLKLKELGILESGDHFDTAAAMFLYLIKEDLKKYKNNELTKEEITEKLNAAVLKWCKSHKTPPIQDLHYAGTIFD